MTKYRLIPEQELLRLHATAKTLMAIIENALHVAGVASLVNPTPVTNLKPETPSNGTPGTVGAAEKAVERALATGQKHRPRRFAKGEPKIADFVFLATTAARFSVDQARQEIDRFVALHPDRRRAMSQVRTALENDERFERAGAGHYVKTQDRG